MKGYTQEELELGRPQVPAEEAIRYCLRRLAEDDQHEVNEFIVAHLTYEEVIGALLHGLDAAEELRKRDEES